MLFKDARNITRAGPSGFNEPRICVQVKSSTSQIDVKVLGELQGVMSKVNADFGLLMSWVVLHPHL
ncbi:MAG: restriction endonuclease [Methanophagales archaeon]|nr:restriction endonuclease [Methanophagales archaeon]